MGGAVQRDRAAPPGVEERPETVMSKNANGEGSIWKRMRDGRHTGYIGDPLHRRRREDQAARRLRPHLRRSAREAEPGTGPARYGRTRAGRHPLGWRLAGALARDEPRGQRPQAIDTDALRDPEPLPSRTGTNRRDPTEQAQAVRCRGIGAVDAGQDENRWDTRAFGFNDPAGLDRAARRVGRRGARRPHRPQPVRCGEAPRCRSPGSQAPERHRPDGGPEGRRGVPLSPCVGADRGHRVTQG